MRVLVACEFSGAVRDAFAARGHYAMSADLLPSENPGHHHWGDVYDIIDNDWDLMVAHPPCTYLAVSGAKHLYQLDAKGHTIKDADGNKIRNEERWTLREEALDFVRDLMDAPIPRIAVENPVSVISSQIRKPDQIIQPWMFGHGERKATCFWLKGLPPLVPTNVVEGRDARVHRMPPGPERWKERSRTFEGIAAAMAEQWG